MNTGNDSQDLVIITCFLSWNFVKLILKCCVILFGLRVVKRFTVKNAENGSIAYGTLDFFLKILYNSIRDIQIVHWYNCER